MEAMVEAMVLVGLLWLRQNSRRVDGAVRIDSPNYYTAVVVCCLLYLFVLIRNVLRRLVFIL